MKEVYVNSDYTYVSEYERKQFDKKQADDIDAEIKKGKLNKKEGRSINENN